MDAKTKRQKMIQALIQEERCQDQQALVSLLAKMGIVTTQAVVSRDLKELGVAKKTDTKGRYYALPAKDLEKQILQKAVLEVNHNKMMIAIHTQAGMAPYVGDRLDESGISILGCIAGENIVFVAPADISQIDHVCQLLEEFFYVSKD